MEPDKEEQWLSHEKFGAVEPDSKSETPSKSRILGIAAGIGVGLLVSIAVGAIGFLLSKMWTADGDTDQEEDQKVKVMRAPGTGGRPIDRKKFDENAGGYFRTLHRNGDDAAVGAFGLD